MEVEIVLHRGWSSYFTQTALSPRRIGGTCREATAGLIRKYFPGPQTTSMMMLLIRTADKMFILGMVQRAGHL
jgi:hypothetical protein